MISAVPEYIALDYSALPPGHKYGIFFPVWNPDWTKLADNKKNEALKKVFSYEKFKPLTLSLIARQSSAATHLGNAVLSLPAESISPFMTGTGIEHPLENGFAFLAPYGLPYLAGSSVKGVLRRTAEYLRDLEFVESNCGWSQSAINILFGPEPETGDSEGAHRGALVFWDVYIQPKDYKLGMDILTPHYTEYYKGNQTPHDSGTPVPVPFLVVPPEAKFMFNIQCNVELIVDENIKKIWRTLVKDLLEHSFEWLGFGAKTASGYGQLKADVRVLHALAEKEAATQKANMPVADRIKEDVQKVWDAEKANNIKKMGGPLENAIDAAIKEAIDLPESERLKVYHLAKEALTWLGKDKKKMKEKLSRLNVDINPA